LGHDRVSVGGRREHADFTDVYALICHTIPAPLRTIVAK
jgi:hypothetical protein